MQMMQPLWQNAWTGQDTGTWRSFSRRKPEMGIKNRHKEDKNHASHKEKWSIPTGFQQRK